MRATRESRLAQGELVVVEGSRVLARVVRDEGTRWVLVEDRGEGPGRQWEVTRDRVQKAR